MIDAAAARSALTTGAAEDFTHEDHVKAAFRLLKRTPFLEAAQIYAAGLRAIAAEAGRPEKFNMTVTLGYLSAIAEHVANDPDTDFEAFIADNSVLLNKALLLRWYDPKRLWSEQAREIFLMPGTAA
ncbi:MAG TPA: hypothetical protein VNH64_03620 [Parvularculaceae bacterium]|nr:hypothetical protein [Parvularculaceae bacterium]